MLDWGVLIGAVLFVVTLGAVGWWASEDARHETDEWKEAHEPCRDHVVLVGPHAGQPNGAKCRRDQRAETRDVGDGTLITCRCAQ